LKKSAKVFVAEKYASEIEIFPFGRGFQTQISHRSAHKRCFHQSLIRQFWMTGFFNRIGQFLPFIQSSARTLKRPFMRE
jgi:ribosome modulation factor